jgi:hypothetical protein
VREETSAILVAQPRNEDCLRPCIRRDFLTSRSRDIELLSASLGPSPVLWNKNERFYPHISSLKRYEDLSFPKMPTSITLSAIALLAVPVAFFIPSPLSLTSSHILNSIDPCLTPGTCVTPLQLNFLLGQLVDCIGPGPSEMVNTLCIIEQLQNPNVTTIDYARCGKRVFPSSPLSPSHPSHPSPKAPQESILCDKCKFCLRGGDLVGGFCDECTC